MSSKLVVALLATTAFVGSGAPAAFAQSDQPAASAGSGLEEIVVTARRREERVQSVPIAITAFSQADIEKKNIREIRGLAQSVPSLSMASSQSDSNGLYSGQLRLRGLPGTDALHVIERYTRPTIGRIDIEVTIDDPKAYTRPWKVNLQWTLQPDTDLIESICEENSKDLPHMVGK